MWWKMKIMSPRCISVCGTRMSVGCQHSCCHTRCRWPHSDSLSPCSVFEVLRSEARVMEGLRSLHIDTPFIHDILKLNVQPSDSDYAVDIRNPAISVRNNIYKILSNKMCTLISALMLGTKKNMLENLEVLEFFNAAFLAMGIKNDPKHPWKKKCFFGATKRVIWMISCPFKWMSNFVCNTWQLR